MTCGRVALAFNFSVNSEKQKEIYTTETKNRLFKLSNLGYQIMLCNLKVYTLPDCIQILKASFGGIYGALLFITLDNRLIFFPKTIAFVLF